MDKNRLPSAHGQPQIPSPALQLNMQTIWGNRPLGRPNVLLLMTIMISFSVTVMSLVAVLSPEWKVLKFTTGASGTTMLGYIEMGVFRFVLLLISIFINRKMIKQ